MSPHRAVIEAGPAAIRRLCCATDVSASADAAEVSSAALGAIDDPVALVGDRPVAVDSLWRAALRAATCADAAGVVLVHPSWWSPARVGVVTAAAGAVSDDVVTRTRAWLLTRAARAESQAVVEFGERLVVVTGAEVIAIPLRTQPFCAVDDVVRVVASMAAEVVVVDALDAPGAAALATPIAGALRESGVTVVEVGDAELARLARSALPPPNGPPEPREPVSVGARGARRRVRTLSGLAGAAVVAAAAPLLMSPTPHVAGRGATSAPVATPPATYLVEGLVALAVPAGWAAQRVVTGPGSARVQLTSPADPEVALHLTQSQVPGETLGATADRLKRAIGAEPAGVFVDFDPAGVSAGRPAVTYRELRGRHQVRWTVILDGPVRISVGCQSPPENEAAVRAACEQAVRSAHAVE